MAQITLRDYLQEIEDALKSKRTEEALAKSQRALEHFPESLEAQRLLGEVYLAQGQMEEAQQAFDWVLTNDPENVIAYCDRALISEREADYETALDCYQQAYELSKGNSSIRELFNVLSARTGQQGFMFSRAGLARLYMRGDLLSQSIQEWETVLAAAPDRLDARVGLLETYWREGSYDKVDELSRQILNDVPGCLKALLLQAYVTSPRDMLEAQDIMRRAEMLDPDLMMAQDLFSDLITSQASNPFLKLIRRKPAALESANGKAAASSVAVSRDYAQVSPEALLTANDANEVLTNWSGLDDWNGIDTFKPQPSQPSAHTESPTLTTWTADAAPPLDMWQALNAQPPAASNNLPNVDAWESPDRSSEQPQGFQFDAWQVSESNPADHLTSPPQPPTPEHKPWEGSEDATYTAPNFDDLNSWSNFNALQSEDAGNTWSSGSSGNDAMSATPAWLNMLTQADQHLPNLPAMPVEPSVAQQPAIEPPPPVAQAQPTVPVTPVPAPDPLPSWDVEPALSSFSADADEEFSFGPEWLKSLGAASINEEETPVNAEPELPVAAPTPPPAVAEDPVAPPAPLPTAPTLPAPEPQPAFDPWATSAPSPSFGNPADENLLATLETLEQSLRAQGFVPHAPNTLSVIAQEQPESAPAAQPVAQQEAVPYELSDLTSALAQQRAALSSALEQLGSLNEQYQSTPAQPIWSAPTPEPPAQPTWSVPTPVASPVWSSPAPEPAQVPVAGPAQPTWSPPVSEPAEPVEEPAWVAALRAVPAPPPLQEQPFYKDGPPTLVPPVYVPPTYRPPAPLDTPLEPAAHVNTYAAPQYQPQPVPAPVPEPTRVQQTASHSTRAEHTPDNELEMTMKRPALRLPLTPPPQPPSRERLGDATETISTVGKMRSSTSKDGSLSARDRLLKGYQHQQVGDYDEAMQEYRFLIRNAPDLLAEIVNNLRALLKATPRYAPGYRVLGDAYMRQGEYLQAMESYNKALTMAKKARA